VCTAILLGLGIQNLKTKQNPTSLSALWDMGLGTVNPRTLVWAADDSDSTSVTRDLINNMLLANVPQFVVSLLYIMLNGVLSCIFLAREWNRYGFARKTLRVTSPAGSQRSSYYLQIPYRYGLPFLVLSGLMHWLVSQSIFLVKITEYDFVGEEVPPWNRGSRPLPGYSCIAIFFVLVIGGVIVTATVGLGLRKYRSGIPLASSCSAAISASCHPSTDDMDASMLPVQWGVLYEHGGPDEHNPEAGETENPKSVGHCSLTSMDVRVLVKGRMYAGLTQ
jgi:hypothetical protein